jgi:hypothetical protein
LIDWKAMENPIQIKNLRNCKVRLEKVWNAVYSGKREIKWKFENFTKRDADIELYINYIFYNSSSEN